MGSEERFWTSRLRWRLRGATQWPAFAILTLLDGLVLDLMPPVATTGLNLIEGVLIATFGNLFLVGVLAPFVARRRAAVLQQAAPASATKPPPEAALDVLRDRTATVLLGLGLLGCLAAGLGNRQLIVGETQEKEEAARAINDFVMHSGNEELIRNNETANTADFGEGLFRICIADDDRRGFSCFLVDTNEDPARVTADPSGEPNPSR